MTSIQEKMKKHVIITSGFMVLFLLGYLTSPYEPQFLGIMLGLLLSFISLWTTYRMSIVIGDVASGIKSTTIFSYLITGLGFGIRIFLAILGVWLALMYPEKLDLILVIAGLALMYVIIMADMLVESGRKR